MQGERERKKGGRADALLYVAKGRSIGGRRDVPREELVSHRERKRRRRRRRRRKRRRRRRTQKPFP